MRIRKLFVLKLTIFLTVLTLMRMKWNIEIGKQTAQSTTRAHVQRIATVPTVTKGKTFDFYNIQLPDKVCNATCTISKKKSSYFIAAVVLVRIYKDDKAGLTTSELAQWFEYLQYAGVQQVYLYDNAKYKEECLAAWCNKHFPTFVTYHDWSSYHPFKETDPHYELLNDCVLRYKSQSTWQLAFDMDEYPFAMNDTKRGFLTRFLTKYSQQYPLVSEFSFKNFLFLSKPSNKTYLVERILRRTPEVSNKLDKPLYKPRCVRDAHLHHNDLKCGRSMDVAPSVMRMNHYWGARLQNWGDDTPEILNKTIPDDSILEVLNRMRNGE